MTAEGTNFVIRRGQISKRNGVIAVSGDDVIFIWAMVNGKGSPK